MNPQEYVKAILAAVGTGVTALGVAAQNGGITLASLLITIGGVLGAFGITFAVPNKNPSEEEMNNARGPRGGIGV